MGKSSKDKRDAYYRLAKEQNWRARSAFKLIQLDEQFDLFSYQQPTSCTRVVDLCAAPGSWSQVLSRVLIRGESFGRRAWMEKMSKLVTAVKASSEQTQHSSTALSQDMEELEISEDEKPKLQPRPNVKIVAIDLQPMAPLEGIIQLQADITHPSTVGRMLAALNPEKAEEEFELVDLVISDGAPDVTGLHDLDIHIQSQLLYSALTLAIRVLRPGGKFVAKIFRGKDVDLIYAQLKLLFKRVHIAKPRSSRASSIEAFVVCEDYTPIPGWSPALGRPVNVPEQIPAMMDEEIRQLPEQTRTIREDGVVELTFPRREADNLQRHKRWVAPFLACGDLDSWDADATYKLPEGHVSLDPVQPPTAPPYKDAIERKRQEGGMYGKTKKTNQAQIVTQPW
ncbi:tRNA (uridine-2'-O-)-methyltransferase trm7 [Neophaeococcomyces mojaviensis]|uniref:tRNA (Uridine-2'-O-)-methyltransferase trm7 n=1 Tax=Neophaeococcomyces mojaviensis TaxID=3383035 RepID=A0ACC3AG06_9EURO|nr:tRNA (uridine-2'-O-)-methyltransferase trm7 [Knufia sp. JES_112]